MGTRGSQGALEDAQVFLGDEAAVEDGGGGLVLEEVGDVVHAEHLRSGVLAAQEAQQPVWLARPQQELGARLPRIRLPVPISFEVHAYQEHSPAGGVLNSGKI